MPLRSLLLLVVLLATTQTDAQTPLRIVTFNAEILNAPKVRAGQLSKFRFDYAREQHIGRVADLIETLWPDVLNLVEVTSQTAVDQIVELLHAKGLTDYRGYHVESNDSFTGMDVAVITRLKVDQVDDKKIRTIYSSATDPTWRQSFSYTDFNGKPRKGTTSVSRNSIYFMTIAGWKLGFFGLHLKSNPSDEYSNAKRTGETEVVVRAIHGEIVRRGYLPIVLGDINDYDPEVPDRDETRSTLTNVLVSLKDYDKQQSGAELFNTAAAIPRQADRYSAHWDWNENGADDPQDVYTMIDHILLPVALRPYLKRSFVAHVVGLETSDHFPVVVDLLLPTKE